MKIFLSKPGQEALFSEYYTRNAGHFSPWNPDTPPGHHGIESWRNRLREWEILQDNQISFHFIGLNEKETDIVGSCNITNIVRGPFQACNMGYSVDQAFEGRGYMKTIVCHVIDFAFDELKLNRIMANHMPINDRSANLLESLGFEKEGYAKRYLKIAGKWEDHVLTSLLNPALREL